MIQTVYKVDHHAEHCGWCRKKTLKIAEGNPEAVNLRRTGQCNDQNDRTNNGLQRHYRLNIGE